MMLGLDAGLSLAPLIDWGWMAALGAALAALSIYGFFRRARGTGWRALAFAALYGALLNPTLVRENRDSVKDVVAIVVDQSPSQKIAQRPARTADALQYLQAALARFADVDTRIVLAGAGPSDAGAVESTRLFAPLYNALADVPARRVGAIFLITDGQVHDAPDPATAGIEAPVHVLLTGERGERDRRLVIENAPRYGIVGKKLALSLRVEDPGATKDTPIRLTLRQDGVARERIVKPGLRENVDFTLSHAGPTLLEIDAEPGPRELTLENNRAVLAVSGVRDRLRVLLITGEPHVGERAWRNSLKSDPAVDLVHFTILRPPDRYDPTPVNEQSLISFPIRELFQDKLGDFDLVIFDRYRNRGLLPDIYMYNIVDYVRQGGALLVADGPSYATPWSIYRTPLGDILPGVPTGRIVERGFRPRLTQIGKRHPVTAPLAPAEAAGWGRWLRQAEAEMRSGRSVMEGADGRPLLILDRVGSGRVALLLSDNLWLWARGFEGGGPQGELQRRLAHWLMKEPELEEDSLSARYDGTRLLVERRTLQPVSGPVTVTTPSGAKHAVVLGERREGVSEGSLLTREPGLYRLSDCKRMAIAGIGSSDSPEFADMRATDEILQPLLRKTGGDAAWVAADLAGSGLPELRRTQPGRRQAGPEWLGVRANGDYTLRGLNSAPLLPPALVLALVLGGLGLAWWRESR